MQNDTDRQSPRVLKTATAIADPVLVLLTRGRSRVLLLAEDVTFDHDHLMELHHVRWVHIRSTLFSSRTREGMRSNIRLNRTTTHISTTIPGHAIRVGNDTRGITIKNLSVVQYDTLCCASPKRLVLAAGVESWTEKLARTLRSNVSATWRKLSLTKAFG